MDEKGSGKESIYQKDAGILVGKKMMILGYLELIGTVLLMGALFLLVYGILYFFLSLILLIAYSMYEAWENWRDG